MGVFLKHYEEPQNIEMERVFISLVSSLTNYLSIFHVSEIVGYSH